MNKKTKTLLLTSAVLVIYGFVFQRVYNNWFASDEEPAAENIFTSEKHETKNIAPKNYQLIADYKDPFLGHGAPVYNTEPAPVKTEIKKSTAPPPPQPEFAWPEITYKGMIKNQNSEKSLAIISVNGKEKIVTPGESIGDVTIASINKENITLTYGKMKKSIGK